MESRDRYFDEIIKAKADLDINHGIAPAWNSLNKTLNQQLPLAEDGQFDQIIKSKISNISDTPLVEGWAAIQSSLDKDIIKQEETFDQIIYKKLSFLNHGRLANWPLFLGQLEDWEHMKRRIISSRILEVFVMITLLLFSYQYSSQKNTPKPLKEKTTSSPTASIETSDNKDQKIVLLDNQHASQLSASESKNVTTIPNSESNKENNVNVIDNLLTTKESKATVNNNAPTLSDKVNELGQIALSNQISHVESNCTNDQIPRGTIYEKSQISISADNHAFVEDNMESSNEVAISSPYQLDELLNPYKELLSNTLLGVKQVAPLSHNKLFSSHKDGWSLAIGASVDAHYIASPSDSEFNLKPFERFNNGYGFSIKINKKKALFNIETGLAYHYIDYIPKELIIIEQEGPFSPGIFEQISHVRTQMHFVELPLEIQYNFLTNSKVRVYASMGASANMNITADYKIERSINRIRGTAKDVRLGTIVDIRDNSLTQSRDYSEGIFDIEGGSLVDNSYLTGNIGVGLDYSLNKSINLFSQVVYHHRLSNKGIGPNEDRFHLTSFNMGFRLPLSPGY